MSKAKKLEDFSEHLKPGTALLQGQFTIEKYLNAGGFGITYLAKDSLERTVVIKECFPSAICRRDKNSVAARSASHKKDFKSSIDVFVREARSLSKLAHPNIVRVHQVFEENNTAYMVIDYIEGRDLQELIEDPKAKIGNDFVVDILTKLLNAIDSMHAKGILHRDISPDNILIRTEDKEPILIDFGAAREESSKKSRILSTLHVIKDGYSPQEFYVAGSKQSEASDLYALGATFYHAITGDMVPNSQIRLAAVAEGSEGPYKRLEGRKTEYPQRFLAAIDKSLEVIPRNRLQTAKEWLDAIDPNTVGAVDPAMRKAVTSRSKIPAIAATLAVLLMGGAAAMYFKADEPADVASILPTATGTAQEDAPVVEETVAETAPVTTEAEETVVAEDETPVEAEETVVAEVEAPVEDDNLFVIEPTEDEPAAEEEVAEVQEPVIVEETVAEVEEPAADDVPTAEELLAEVDAPVAEETAVEETVAEVEAPAIEELLAEIEDPAVEDTVVAEVEEVEPAEPEVAQPVINFTSLPTASEFKLGAESGDLVTDVAIELSDVADQKPTLNAPSEPTAIETALLETTLPDTGKEAPKKVVEPETAVVEPVAVQTETVDESQMSVTERLATMTDIPDTMDDDTAPLIVQIEKVDTPVATATETETATAAVPKTNIDLAALPLGVERIDVQTDAFEESDENDLPLGVERIDTDGNQANNVDLAALPTGVERVDAPTTQTETVTAAPAITEPLVASLSGWQLDVPFFVSQPVGAANQGFPVIAAVQPYADLDFTGPWITPGVTIYSINGELVASADQFNGFLNEVLGGSAPDNVTATVRIKRTPDAPIEDVTMTLKHRKSVELTNGVIMDQVRLNGEWRMVARFVPEGVDGLNVGDLVLSERTIGKILSTAPQFSSVIGDLQKRGASVAQFEVSRNGQRVQTALDLLK